MYLLRPSVSTQCGNPDYFGAVYKLASAAGICYNVRMKTDVSFAEMEEYVGKRMKARHESILEHVSLAAEITCDRGVSHEIVRHRLCAFTQSSTRYCDYAGEREDGQCRFIIPLWTRCEPGQYTTSELVNASGEKFYLPEDDEQWFIAMIQAERFYHSLREKGWRPEMARSVLPNSLMTKIMWTANIREWRHILSLRALETTGKVHPQMLEIMVPLLYKWANDYPLFFGDLLAEYEKQDLARQPEALYKTEAL